MYFSVFKQMRLYTRPSINIVNSVTQSNSIRALASLREANRSLWRTFLIIFPLAHFSKSWKSWAHAMFIFFHLCTCSCTEVGLMLAQMENKRMFRKEKAWWSIQVFFSVDCIHQWTIVSGLFVFPSIHFNLYFPYILCKEVHQFAILLL